MKRPSGDDDPSATPTPLPAFEALFGRVPETQAQAPGRVNLIGEHTDYSGGFVLPTAIPRYTRVQLARRADQTVRAVSENAGGAEPVTYTLGKETRTQGWLDYLQGVTYVLAREGFDIAGFDIRITSSVPLGAGLSSSASFEVAVLRGLRALFALDLNDVRLAVLGQKAENDFVGAPVGVMDQMAASLADTGTALFIDTQSLDFQKVGLPADTDVIVFNSGVTHNHAGGEYRTRRAECERAAAALGVQLLREVTRDRLADIERLPEPDRQRARHVVTENARVGDFVAALRNNDVSTLGRLLFEGHASLRDDFQVSVPEIDLIVDLARQTEGVHGARLTGGGFGGSVVILTRAQGSHDIAKTIADRYRKETGRVPGYLSIRDAAD